MLKSSVHEEPKAKMLWTNSNVTAIKKRENHCLQIESNYTFTKKMQLVSKKIRLEKNQSKKAS